MMMMFLWLETIPKLKSTVKHLYKVHVWAGISKRGPTNIVIYNGTSNSHH